MKTKFGHFFYNEIKNCEVNKKIVGVGIIFLRDGNLVTAFGYRFYHYLWSSVILAGPEVGDHFTLNLYP